jgi:uncharacterized damage-inducible protein DinB
MELDAAFLTSHLEYTFWASKRSLDSVRGVPNDGGAFETLLHIFRADRLWLSRTTATPRTALADDHEAWTFDTLAPAWEHVANGWREWAEGISDARSRLEYRNLAGEPQSVELWEMVFHVVNHGTYHRGQVATRLRQASRTPVATDFHIYRMLQASAASSR